VAAELLEKLETKLAALGDTREAVYNTALQEELATRGQLGREHAMQLIKESQLMSILEHATTSNWMNELLLAIQDGSAS